MYLLPGSILGQHVVQKAQVPLSLSAQLLPGFDATFYEGRGYTQLCQHYGHDEVDLYYYQFDSSFSAGLFSAPPVEKWVLGFVKSGSLCFTYFDGSTLRLSKNAVLFFPTKPGSHIQLEVGVGQHELICCCFKSSFSHYFSKWYPPLMHPDLPYPLVLPFIDYVFQLEWQGLLPYAIDADLYPAMVAAQTRLLLGHCAQAFRQRSTQSILHTQHPGVDLAVIEKAYLVRDIIHAHPDQALHLSTLCKKTAWNLQGLKTGFSQVFGMSPHQYIMRYRLELAVTLLQREKDWSVQTIGLACGYRRPHHFIEQFKQVYGKTPGAFRRDLESS